MPKNKIIAGNWKMNLTVNSSVALAKALLENYQSSEHVSTWVAPSTIALSEVSKVLKNSKIAIGAQNVHWAEKGAFTGETSALSLQELGVTFTLTGHSERRRLMGESIEQVNQRTLAGLRSGLKVILCVGETLSEREEGLTNKILEQQLVGVLKDLPTELSEKLVIAYEPVWAIGTGKVASIIEIADAHSFIKSFANKIIASAKQEIPILYGGSVTPENFPEIIRIDNVHGALVGGASLKAEQFLELVRIARNC